MRADFSDDVFSHPSKGLYLNAIINIAVGLREDGLVKLNLFIEEQEKKLKVTKRTSPKLEKSISTAKMILKLVKDDNLKSVFF